MGIRLEECPDSFLEKLFPEERKKHKVSTWPECEARYARRKEKEMHDKFSGWLNLREIPQVHASMAKPSTIEVGHPDHTICVNTLMIEFKAPGTRLSEAQEKRIAYLRKWPGNTVVICYSLQEAIDETKKFLRTLIKSCEPFTRRPMLKVPPDQD